MHDIEPYYHWRDKYTAEQDENSPFFGHVYSEFSFTDKIYNYYIHPQWDNFGSNTLYAKILFSDYDKKYCIIEMIGEWNDCLHNDIMFFKREVIDKLIHHDIHKFIIICENVLNFHASDDAYYEEWFEDIIETKGWICFINTLNHVEDEMNDTQLYNFIHFGNEFQNISWRPHKPKQILNNIEFIIQKETPKLN